MLPKEFLEASKEEMQAALNMAGFFLASILVSFLVASQRHTEFIGSATEGLSGFNSPAGIGHFLLIFLVFTGIFLLSVRMNWRKLLIGIFVIAIGEVAGIFLSALLSPLGIQIPLAAAWLVGTLLVLLVIWDKSWWAMTGLGIAVSGSLAAVMGLALTVPVVLLLMALLTVYDYIAVYKTGHMIDLAEGAINMKLPVFLVSPKERDYDFEGAEFSRDGERGAFFLGFGDVVFPGMFLVSVFYSPALAGYAMGPLLVTLAALAGILGAFALLLRDVLKGVARPGLLYLNPGAFIGFLIGWVVVTGTLLGWL